MVLLNATAATYTLYVLLFAGFSVALLYGFKMLYKALETKDEDGKTQLLHTLNGSSLALPRIMAALLENNQQQDGIHLPKILHPYFGAAVITN